MQASPMVLISWRHTYLDVENTESNTGTLHKTPTGIPKNMASLWGDYKILFVPFDGLQIGDRGALRRLVVWRCDEHVQGPFIHII